MVASEPITASRTDWVEVPRNSMVIIVREKGDVVNVMVTPISGRGEELSRQKEVSRCLDVICSGRGLSSKKSFNGLAHAAAGPVLRLQQPRASSRPSLEEAVVIPDDGGKFRVRVEG